MTYEMELERERRKGRDEEKTSILRRLIRANAPMVFLKEATGWTEEQIREFMQKDNSQPIS